MHVQSTFYMIIYGVKFSELEMPGGSKDSCSKMHTRLLAGNLPANHPPKRPIYGVNRLKQPRIVE